MSTLTAVPSWSVESFTSSAPALRQPAPLKDVFTEAARWVLLPRTYARAATAPQLSAHEVLQWTGLSQRQLADILGVTHPTVGTLLEGSGSSLSKRPEVLQRLEGLHELAKRLHPFEERQRGSVKRALLVEINDGVRVADLAAGHSVADAYREALQLLAPKARRVSRPSPVKRPVGTATVELSH